MSSTPRKLNKRIWLLGLGYFIFYAPYSAITKAVTSGLAQGGRPTPGIQILPVSVFATVVTLFVIITVAGWWKYSTRRTLFKFSVPVPNRWTFVSGVCMAVIIGTTTLAFSFAGISVVLVLVLLRGGTLALGPLIDVALKRRVRWFSWAAMAISFLAILIALADVDNYKLTLFAVLDVAAYITAYFIRLTTMTRLAKSADDTVTLRYFIEEQIVATPLLLISLGVLAMIGGNETLLGIRHGFSFLLGSDLLVPSLLVGIFYGALCVCTTLIFLDRRENTFCVPMHCGSSMLSGIVAAYALYILFNQATPSKAQLTSATLVIVSLAFLSPLHHFRLSVNRLIDALARSQLASQMSMFSFPSIQESPVPAVAYQQSLEASTVRRRLVLFICSGNTCRSAMAEAIARSEIARQLSGRISGELPMMFMSAGISAKPGAPMTAEARDALRTLGVDVRDHASQAVTLEMVTEADVIYCMARSHYDRLLQMFPEARERIRCLDPEGDIDDPLGQALEKFIDCATRIQTLIRKRFDELGLPPELAAHA